MKSFRKIIAIVFMGLMLVGSSVTLSFANAGRCEGQRIIDDRYCYLDAEVKGASGTTYCIYNCGI